MLKLRYILDHIKKHPGVTPTKLETAFCQNVSHHLEKLRQLGEVEYRRVKQGRYWVHRYYVTGKG